MFNQKLEIMKNSQVNALIRTMHMCTRALVNAIMVKSASQCELDENQTALNTGVDDAMAWINE